MTITQIESNITKLLQNYINDKYNKLVYKISQLQDGVTVQPKDYSLDDNEFKSIIESNDGKQYSKIERVEVANHTHITVGRDNIGNITIGNKNTINSEFNQKFDDLVKSIKESSLQDKETILKELNIHKNDETALKKFMGTLLSRGAEVASITSAVGAMLSL